MLVTKIVSFICIFNIEARTDSSRLIEDHDFTSSYADIRVPLA